MNESHVTRRDFLKTSAWATALFGAAPLWAMHLDEAMPMDYLSPVPTSAPIEWTTPADLAETDLAVLVLNRIAFGPRAGDVERVKAMGVDAYIEQQLNPEGLNDAAVEGMLKAFPSLTMDIPTLNRLYGVTALNVTPTNTTNGVDVAGAVRGFLGLFDPNAQAAPAQDMMPAANKMQSVLELMQATVLRQVYSERQLFEMMVDFWSNHFNIYILKNQCRILKTWDDREVIRKHALGKFRDLLFATSQSPAMLVFLDNVVNIKGVPQENYARELMELHTLGVDGGYTSDDVKEVARAFTGWSLVTPARAKVDFSYEDVGDFLFRKNQHDDGAKKILTLNLPAGGGVTDGEQVLEMLATHPKTAAHIASKLVKRFVDDNPPEALVGRVADTFMKTDGDIKAMLQTIFSSDEFRGSFGKKVKRPLEFVASSLRALDAQPTDVELQKVPLKSYDKGNKGKKKAADEPIARTLRALGQVPFMWQAPNGYPDAAGAWVNSNNLLTRWNFALGLTTNRVAEFDVALNSAAQASDAAGLVDEWSGKVLNRALPDADRAKLVSFVSADSSATRVENLVALLVASPHFQYR